MPDAAGLAGYGTAKMAICLPARSFGLALAIRPHHRSAFWHRSLRMKRRD
jgi:hypothetical protein